MRTPKAKKLPSGNWRIQLQVNGERHSITGKTKAEVTEKAKLLFAGEQIEKRSVLTVDKAFERYISNKTGVLSPSTIQGYNSIRRNYLQSIMKINLSELTQQDVQRAVAEDRRAGKSPKTIRNAHGLLAAVLAEYRPKFTLNTRLPQKQPYEARIPTEEEMGKIWAEAKGSKYELPILLASWLGLRMSEIRGLKFSDIRDGRLHVQRAIVSSDDGDVEKGTKSVSGDRWIKLPDEIMALIKKARVGKKSNDVYICPYADVTIWKNFVKICEKAGVEPCRFHDLRHFAASESLALGVPDKYSMKRMGHKTDYMLKTVYQHTMRSKEDEFAELIDDRMSDIYKNAHDSAHGDLEV